MASNSRGAEEQANAVASARAAAAGRVLVPRWYWLTAGVGIGFAVFALATYVPILMAIAALVITAGTRLLSIVLTRATGIRFRQLVSQDASWLKISFVAMLMIVFLAAIAWDRASGSSWPGAWLGAVAVIATLAFGEGYNWFLRHPANA